MKNQEKNEKGAKVKPILYNLLYHTEKQNIHKPKTFYHLFEQFNYPILEEEVGFEPTEGFPSPPFQDGAIGHSAILPTYFTRYIQSLSSQEGHFVLR